MSYLLHPYFYIIRDKRNNMLYVGSKFSKLDSYPELFMKEDGYTTSSPIINSIIDEHGLDTFEIVRLVLRKDAYDYETRFLRKVDARNNPRFYNAHNNQLFCPGSEDFEIFMLEKYGVRNVNYVQEIKQKSNEKISQTMLSEEWKNTIGKKAAADRAATVSDEIWKETIGKEAKAKERATKSTEEWKRTTGAKAAKNRLDSLSKINDDGLTGFQLMEKKRQETVSKFDESKKKQIGSSISIKKKGVRKLIKDGHYKMVIPNSIKWETLLKSGWKPKSEV